MLKAIELEVSADQLHREVGELVRQARRSAGLTQEQLASALALERTTITNIEAGKQSISILQLYGIARVLGTRPEALLPHFDPEPELDSALPDKYERIREAILSNIGASSQT